MRQHFVFAFSQISLFSKIFQKFFNFLKIGGKILMEKSPKEMLVEILNYGKFNQQELAKKIGVSPAQITRWLGSAEPRLVHFRKIEQIYNEMVV